MNEENEDIRKAIFLLREIANHTESPEMSREFVLIRVAAAIAFIADFLIDRDTLRNSDCITVGQLKQFVANLPEFDIDSNKHGV